MTISWLENLKKSSSVWFSERQNIKNILSNSAWLYFDKAIRLLVGLVLTPWLARYLGPEQFGLLNYAISFVMIFTAVATLGLDTFITRGFIEEPDKSDSVMGTAFWLKLIGGVIALLGLYITIYIISHDDNRLLYIALILSAGTFFLIFDVFAFWNQSQMQQKFTVIAKNCAFIITSLIKILFILQQAPLEYFAIIASVEILLSGILMLVIYVFHQKHTLNWHFDYHIAEKLLGVSWPVIISSTAAVLYMRADQIMLGNIIDEHAVGIYSAAQKIAELWYVIPIVFVSASLPVLLRTKQESEERFMHQLQRVYSLLVILGYLIAIPMTFLSDTIIVFLFGIEYQSAGPVLSIYIWSAIFVFFNVLMSVWITAYGYTKYALIQSLSGAFVNIILNLILIPEYGAIGAAWATLISQFFSAYLFNSLWLPARSIFKIQTNSLLFVKR